MKYRKELDGLRALAVLAVIIYHAKLTYLGIPIIKGGFFGVDIFFVLSGYLITSIITNKMDEKCFSILDFYWRRAKRIVPALLFMLFVTSILSYLLLLPDELISYTDSLKSALYFGSNHFFLNQDSYVAEASIYKLLLHTWSLSVEWQFYVIYPIIIAFIYRFFKQYTFNILILLGLLSLQFSQLLVTRNPDMAFYLLPSRAWELIFGGLLTFFNRDLIFSNRNINFQRIINLLPSIGIYMIVYSLIFIGDETLHPSFITLIPVLGTMLIILFSQKGELINDTLSLKPFVLIGVISYSLYLWHQPIFVLFRLIEHSAIRYIEFLALVVLSIIMATISYKLIEKPFRVKYSNKKILSISLTSIVLLLLFSNYILNTNGAPKRMESAAKEALNKNPYNCLIAANASLDSGPCIIGNKDNISIIMVGDSHADAITTSISSTLDLNKYGMLAFTKASCPFIFGITVKDVPEYNCTEYNEKTLNVIQSEYPSIPIVITNRIAVYLYGQTNPERVTNGDNSPPAYLTKKHDTVTDEFFDEFSTAYIDSVCRISRDNPVFITTPIPEMRINVPKAMTNRLSFISSTFGVENKYNQVKIKKDIYLKRNKKFIDLINKTEKQCDIKVLDVTNYLCDDEFCYGSSSNGRPYYYDGDHLSDFGNKLLSPMFIDSLNIPFKSQ